MFHNLHIKIIAFALAVGFWVSIVSLEQRFVEVPGKVAIQVFNQGQEIALASKLGEVSIAVRGDNSLVLAKVSAQDFEAYVDLRDIGVGKHTVPVSVTSKNPQLTILKFSPREVEVELEPLRQKVVSLVHKVSGTPAANFRIEAVTLSPKTITVIGAENVLKNVTRGEVLIKLDGSEQETFVAQKLSARFVDSGGSSVEGVSSLDPASEIEARVSINAGQASREVPVRAQLIGSAPAGLVKEVIVTPALITIIGEPTAVDGVDFLQTEAINLQSAGGTFDRVVKIILPEKVSLAPGAKSEVKVLVKIENI